jgi:hypothetical protein
MDVERQIWPAAFVLPVVEDEGDAALGASDHGVPSCPDSR